MADPHDPEDPDSNPLSSGKERNVDFHGQFDDFSPRIWDHNEAMEESDEEVGAKPTFNVFAIAFRIPPWIKKDNKFQVVTLIKELFKAIKKADPSAVMHEPTTDGTTLIGNGINNPDAFPSDSEKLRTYVHGLEVHSRTQSLTGQLNIQSQAESFSSLKRNPSLFDWLRRSGFHLTLNCLPSTKVQAVGQFLHVRPSDARASQIEEALAKRFPSPGPPNFSTSA